MAVPLDDQVVQILALLRGQTVQGKVIQNEQIRRQVAAEDTFERMVATGLAEVFQQRVGAREDHAVAGSDGGGAECLNQKCFPDADGSNQDDVLLALEELESEDVLKLLTIDVHG